MYREPLWRGALLPKHCEYAVQRAHLEANQRLNAAGSALARISHSAFRPPATRWASSTAGCGYWPSIESALCYDLHSRHGQSHLARMAKHTQSHRTIGCCGACPRASSLPPPHNESCRRLSADIGHRTWRLRWLPGWAQNAGWKIIRSRRTGFSRKSRAAIGPNRTYAETDIHRLRRKFPSVREGNGSGLRPPGPEVPKSLTRSSGDMAAILGLRR